MDAPGGSSVTTVRFCSHAMVAMTGKNSSVALAILGRVYFALEGRSGWALGEYGRILGIRDGGQYWALQKSGTDVQLLNMQFMPMVGWVDRRQCRHCSFSDCNRFLSDSSVGALTPRQFCGSGFSA